MLRAKPLILAILTGVCLYTVSAQPQAALLLTIEGDGQFFFGPYDVSSSFQLYTSSGAGSAFGTYLDAGNPFKYPWSFVGFGDGYFSSVKINNPSSNYNGLYYVQAYFESDGFSYFPLPPHLVNFYIGTDFYTDNSVQPGTTLISSEIVELQPRI